MQSISVLGATGSIGISTLSVLAAHPERYRVYALTGHSNLDRLAEQVQQFRPEVVALADPAALPALRQRLKGWQPRLVAGPEGLAEVAAAPEVDTVVAAIVGAAGLAPTLAAVRAGKKVLLANKEALVMAGSLFMRAVDEAGAQLLPVDSEHNAIFQCLPPGAAGQLAAAGVRKLWLTASGGPFRETPLQQLAEVTPQQACAHPNWSMGQKISVDSATMMNKGLEFIEAHWLFGAPLSAIEILIHPQSVVHSMVEYCDGSVLAQLGQPDMRTPIAHCLGYPARVSAPVEPLDFARMGALTFAPPDLTRFPCLALALAAAERGGYHAIALNAANEVAVAAFLAGQLSYPGIARVVESVLAVTNAGEPDTLAAVITADSVARRLATETLAAKGTALSRS